jgi:hypothetical protein
VPETEGVTQFEVEVQKLGKKELLRLRVSVIRGPRGKTKMVGEAYTVTPNHPFINFRVVNANDEAGVFHEFLRLLFHRGYLPLRMREIVKWRGQEWKPIDYSGIEGVEAVLARERPREQ